MSDDLLERLPDGYTPGPWWTDGRYSGREMGCAIIAARTDSGPLPGNPTRGAVAFATAILNTEARRCEANARLIALAPELAAAYRSLRAQMAASDPEELPWEAKANELSEWLEEAGEANDALRAQLAGLKRHIENLYAESNAEQVKKQSLLAQLAEATKEAEAWRNWYSGKAGHNPPAGGDDDQS